jgi:hypothetical protein
MDMLGTNVQTLSANEAVTHLNIYRLVPGTYILLSLNNGKWQQIGKIYKQ